MCGVYITGDLHGDISIKRLSSKHFPHGRLLTKSDFLIVAGDFGLLWDGGKSDNFWLNWLDEKPWTTLFVDGNHENFDLLESYPVEQWNGGKVRKIRPSIYHLMRGQVFDLHGHKFFTFGGASSIDREDRIEGESWWARELPNEKELEEALDSLAKHSNRVDYVVTHTCPTSALPMLGNLLECTMYPPDIANEYLEIIRKRISYQQWYFGHFHWNLKLPNNMWLIYNNIMKVC